MRFNTEKLCIFLKILTGTFSIFFILFTCGFSAEAKNVNVTDFGAIPGDYLDDTEGFNKAIETVSNAGGGAVKVPAGLYYITPSRSINEGICLKDNVELLMSPTTVLEVMPSVRDDYHVFNIYGCNNVKIAGGQLRGEKNRHQGGGGEFGHGVYIRDSSNVTLYNMKIADNWGDGIYLGTLNDMDNVYGCNKITIKKCTISGNRRNNISIVDANNVTIDGCKIKNARGTAPQAGIDIEPNVRSGGYLDPDQICRNINIKNTKITCYKKNSSNYFAILIINNWFAIGKNCTVASNVKIKNCNLQGACGMYSGYKVRVINSKISGTLIYLKYVKLKNTKYKKKIKWPG
jgi:polygalacturonase